MGETRCRVNITGGALKSCGERPSYLRMAAGEKPTGLQPAWGKWLSISQQTNSIRYSVVRYIAPTSRSCACRKIAP